MYRKIVSKIVNAKMNVFELCYKQHLAGHLLAGHSMSVEMERATVGLLK